MGRKIRQKHDTRLLGSSEALEECPPPVTNNRFLSLNSIQTGQFGAIGGVPYPPGVLPGPGIAPGGFQPGFTPGMYPGGINPGYYGAAPALGPPGMLRTGGSLSAGTVAGPGGAIIPGNGRGYRKPASFQTM